MKLTDNQVDRISKDGLIHDSERLKELQALPLHRKVAISVARISEWYQYWNGKVYVAFSGGKDSTVLLYIVRKLFPDVPAVFSNTGLEFPELQKFVKTLPNITVLYPKIKFPDVISTYGYPLISKETAEAIYYARKIKPPQFCGGGVQNDETGVGLKTKWHNWRRACLCNAKEQLGENTIFNKEKWLPIARELPVPISHKCCDIMKKHVMTKYVKETGRYAIIGTMAEESRMRKQAWIRHGCNAFRSKKPTSQPLSFWTEQDILTFIKQYNIPICSVYGDIEIVDSTGKMIITEEAGMPNGCKYQCSGCRRTGCIYCAFGAHLDKGETRFQSLAKTHPRQYEYCINGGQWVENPAYDPSASMEPDEMGWTNWNPKKIWVPSKKGLGMGKVFDMCNDLIPGLYRY